MLKSDSKVGYVPSPLATQMIENDWAAHSETMPIRTEVTILARGLMLIQGLLVLTGI